MIVHIRYRFVVGVFGILSGCTSIGLPSSNLIYKKKSVNALGAPLLPNLAPLPSQLPLNSIGRGRQLLKFQGWDFNDDGKIDFLEMFDSHGNLLGKSYDFDFNGKVDKKWGKPIPFSQSLPSN